MSLEKIKRLRCLIWRLYTRKKVYVESRVIEYLCAYLDSRTLIEYVPEKEEKR